MAIVMEDDRLASGADRRFIELPEAHCCTGGDSGDDGGGGLVDNLSGRELRAGAEIKFCGNRRDSGTGGSDGDGRSRSDSSVSRSPGLLSALSGAADSVQFLPVSGRSTCGSVRVLQNLTMLSTLPNTAPNTRLE